jgi:hypothetical protein
MGLALLCFRTRLPDGPAWTPRHDAGQNAYGDPPGEGKFRIGTHYFSLPRRDIAWDGARRVALVFHPRLFPRNPPTSSPTPSAQSDVLAGLAFAVWLRNNLAWVLGSECGASY